MIEVSGVTKRYGEKTAVEDLRVGLALFAGYAALSMAIAAVLLLRRDT